VSDKPSYLGLLNAIAVAEAQAHDYLVVWADVTPSPDVRKVLLTVAAREGEHGMSFSKRINELGYEVRRKDDPQQKRAMELVASNRSDLKKMEKLKLHLLDTGDQPDIFDGFFKDHSIDIRTGELLGRYIAEERDTARLLRSCYEQLAAADNAGAAKPAADSLSSLEAKVDALCGAVDELRQMVCAQAVATNGTPANGTPANGRKSAKAASNS
jgi:rubrerythrin